MNSESKTTKAVIIFSAFPLPLAIGYIAWVEHPQLYIFLKNYKAILYACNFILWTGFFLTLFYLGTRKYFLLAVLMFIATMPFIFVGSFLSLDDGTKLSNNIAETLDTIQVGNDTYYLTSENGEWGHYYLKLYKCEKHKVYCEQLPFERDNYIKAQLVEDPSLGEIKVVDSGKIIYTYYANQ